MKTHAKAFTIIEILGAIVIVAVLITIVFPRLIASAREARYKACRANIAMINEQVELYYTRTGEWPRGDLSDIGRDWQLFPDGIPDCPTSGFNYWIYEDTHRVGGHTENNPDSHRELGFTTAGDYIYDSQGRLIGSLSRQYDSETNQIRLTRDINYVYDEETDRLISFERVQYDAYGNKTNRFIIYDRVHDDEGNFIAYKQDRFDMYDNFTFTLSYNMGTDGLVKSYTRTEYDALGNERFSLEHSNFVYDGLERRTSWTVTCRDPHTAVYQHREWSQTFDGDTNRIATRVINYRPEGGGPISQTISFSDYVYDDSGRATSYTRAVSAGGQDLGTIVRSCTYDDTGREANATYAYNDAQGNPIGGCVYSDYTFNYEGRRTGFTKTDADVSGSLTGSTKYKNQTWDFVTNSYLGANVTYRNADNVITGTRDCIDYTYNELGQRTGQTEVCRDSQGNVTERYEYSNVAYDSAGRGSSHILTTKDSNGNPTKIVEVSERTYYAHGRTSGRLTVTRKPDGSFESSRRYLNYGHDITGKMVSYDYVDYNEAGEEIGSGSGP